MTLIEDDHMIEHFSLPLLREGITNGMVDVNPTRLLRQQKEENERIRFLDRAEYAKVKDIIAQVFPQHLVEFVISVNTT